jgi:methylmalonyl-CoA mutase N-terminal domain/subunit
MRELLDGMPLDKVTTSMTINSTAAILLLLYELVAEEQGVAPADIGGGTIQNDLLKEYIARGTYIYPPRQSMRLITDIFAYCNERIPRWNTISISGYHIREAGSTAVQEIAFTIANGIAYVQAAIDAGLDVDEFAPRLSFFWNAHNNFLEEIAKYRAARRMWYSIMGERFGAKKEASKLLRFHTQTGGSTLTAQQPENNVVRVALQALAAVMGGTQSLHTNGRDEALALPTEDAARIALRTQQIIGCESGVANTIDPFAGSYHIEQLTNEIEDGARELLTRIEAAGGTLAAIEAGYIQRQVQESAYKAQLAIDSGEAVVVGVNKFTTDDPSTIEVFQVDPQLEAQQQARVQAVRAARHQGAWQASLDAVRSAAAGSDNLVPPIIAAVEARATVGEIADTLRSVFGEYREVSLD